MLADVFNNFGKMFDPAHFLSGTELAWQPALKKIKVKVDLLTYIDMLLVVKKRYKREYVMLYIDMRKLIINTLNNVIKIKNLCILTIGT